MLYYGNWIAQAVLQGLARIFPQKVASNGGAYTRHAVTH